MILNKSKFQISNFKWFGKLTIPSQVERFQIPNEKKKDLSFDLCPLTLSEGFTLIELLVVMSIIAILIALSGFGLQGARESSRDAKRRADLETIRSGLELFRSDCNRYPSSAGDGFYDVVGTSLADNDGGCAGTGSRVYVQKVPTDPLTGREYYYNSAGTSYQLCAALEGGGADTCLGVCGGSTCNYKTTNP